MEYGLPLILGSCEVSLLELSNLYSALAHGGISRPIRMTQDEIPGRTTKLVSKEASWLVSDILTELKRPDLPGAWEFTADMPKVAWKTGTSYGRKDAWAIGYDPDFTVGVWTGNFSAEGSVALVGAEASAPLMFDIFAAIQPDGNDSWFKMPSGIDERAVCAVSGQVNTDACPNTITEHYIVGVSPSTRCTAHRTILVDTRTGFSVCQGCLVPGRFKEMTVEDWPPRLASWLAQSGIVNREPPHNPKCRGQLAGEGPVIVSPERDAVYSLRSSVPRNYQHILFKASLPLDSRKAHWFVDGQLIASAPSDSSVFYLPDKGSHHIMCVDSYGRSSSVDIKVQ
jgi:penicillin-binding protein 1C